jgi:hypothetical protein
VHGVQGLRGRRGGGRPAARLQHLSADMLDLTLAQRLIDAVGRQHFELTPDRQLQGAALADFPSIDLAVVGFAPGQAPRAANLLFSRHARHGHVAALGARGERPADVRFWADLTDDLKVSIAWQPRTNWAQLPLRDLLNPPEPATPGAAAGPALRVIAPYPASLLKVMVALGVGLALDAGLARLADVEAAARVMIVDSDNDATTLMVRRLHEWGLIVRGPHGETHNAVNALLASRGLHTLQLNNTARDGGWGNAAGSGVGHIHMTAWDTLRLFWLLDPDAPPAPWPGAAPLLSAGSRDVLLRWLGEHSPNRILFRDEAASGLHFFHKTGTTANYGSDAGIVRARAPGRRHYIVALLSNLGSRYGPPGAEFDVSPKLSGLGLAVDAVMQELLGP